MADDGSCVASTFMVDTRISSCGVVDIRNVYVLPGGRGGTCNEAYPTTSFSYRIIRYAFVHACMSHKMWSYLSRRKKFHHARTWSVVNGGIFLDKSKNGSCPIGFAQILDSYPQNALSAQFRLHDASAARKYVKGTRGVVWRAIAEIHETVRLSEISGGVMTGAQCQLWRPLEPDRVDRDPIGNVVSSVHLSEDTIFR